jgi:signal transduction histidine kinase/DNA-binding response OmpR family regulator
MSAQIAEVQDIERSAASWPARLVAHVPTSIRTKLLAAFLALVVLLIALGAVGIWVLSQSNGRAQDLGTLERKVSAYRQLQNDTTTKLYTGASILASAPDIKGSQAGGNDAYNFWLGQLHARYDFAKVEPLAKGDGARVLGQVETDYNDFIDVMIRLLDQVGAGNVDNAQEIKRSEANPLADRLQRQNDDLVTRAEAEVAATINQNDDAYRNARWIVIGIALASIVLAGGLGLTISSSLSGPVRRMDAHLERVTAGDFSRHVEVQNKDELGTLAANLNRMNDELGRLYHDLEAASRHKSDFLATMSHELRTPLNAVIGFSEVLLERMFGDLNDKQAEYLDDILSSGRHLLSLINDILDLSKVEAGKMELDLSAFSLESALENGVTMVRERAALHNIVLHLDVAPDASSLEADERKVKQVVFNLLSNAVKFTPDGGRIDVTARRLGDEVQVAVSDTGVGIDPADQALIFEEFRQVGPREGTGLGLALAQKFIDLHGGRLWVESALGAGSTFTFSLPMRHPSAAAAVEGADAVASRQPTLVLVEDDQHSIDLLQIYLDGAGFNIVVCRNGEVGIEAARRLRPAAIILDLMLPGMDGWEFLSLAKADEGIAGIPVIIVSTLDEPGKGFALGAADYLVKPLRRENLLASLERQRSQGSAVSSSLTILAIDDDPMALELIEAVLHPEGYKVLRALGGEEGIQIAREAQPALIIVDLLMPDVDGFAVVDRLRAEALTAAIPIVVLTSKSLSPDDRTRLNSRISHLAGKMDFSRGAFVDLVKRLAKSA